MPEAEVDIDFVLTRFNRLIQELLRGTIKRNCFLPWEIEILLDIENCEMQSLNRRETLRRYQRAVKRHLDNGGVRPLLMSEYLANRRTRGRKRITASRGQNDQGSAQTA